MARMNVIFRISIVILILAIGCDQESDFSSENSTNVSVESVVTSATNRVETALEDISGTLGYELLTLTEVQTKSATEDTTEDELVMSISLDDIKGEYVYAPTVVDTVTRHWGEYIVYNYFEWVTDNDNFVIKLPEDKATSPWNLYTVEDGDDTLENNFIITTSEFMYHDYEGWHTYDYLLNTRVDISDVYAGSLYINQVMNGRSDYTYSAEYDFDSNYSISVEHVSGDTSNFVYSLNEDGESIFKEEIARVKNDDSNYHKKRRYSVLEHSITIGDFQLIKTKLTEEDTTIYEVYVNDVLQDSVTVEEVYDNSDSDASAFCRKATDLQITYADGTVVLLSDLIGDARDIMDELFDSLFDVYFAKGVLNNLAWDIYSENNE